jgi:hypothetical protein
MAMAVLAEALAFARRGIKIFPLPFGGKRPTVSFPELATDDPEKITQLWRDPVNPHHELNIGVLCGSGGNGLIIFDIDTKWDQKFGHSALANYIAIGGTLDTLVVRTASGGLQAYFRLPRGMTFANMQGLVPSVDVRCENGYGIAPGSFAIESGGSYELYHDQAIAELPQALLSLLKPVRERKERLNGHADSEKAIPLYIEYLKRVEPAIEGQGGDTHTYNVACMGVRDYGLSEPTTTLLMLEHFNPRCMPPWAPDELKRKVENAEAYAIGETGSRDPDKIMEGVTFTPATTVAATPLVYREDEEDTLLEPGRIPLTDWLVHPLLIRGEVTVFVGPNGVGKSAWLIALAAHAAYGKMFGPHAIPSPFDTMLYNPEDSRAIISGRAEVTCTAYGMDWGHVSQHFHVLSQNNKQLTLVELVDRKMRVPEDTVRYLSNYKEKHPNVKAMFFDPLRKMLRGINENDNAQMSEAMVHLNAIAYSLNLSVLVSHHTGKNLLQRKDLDPDSADLSVGAGAIVSSARIAANVLPQTPTDIAIQGRNDNYFSTRISKCSYGPKGMLTWWERRILRASNGQGYPTPMKIDIKNAMASTNASYVTMIGDHMLAHHRNTLAVSQAALVIADNSPFNDRSVKSLGEGLRILFQRGNITHPYVAPDGQRFAMVLDTESKMHQFSLIEVDTSLPYNPARMELPPRPEGEDDTDE